MITPEALAISPGTVTNVDVEPFFVEDWSWRDDDSSCKWNWEDEDSFWEWRYNKEREVLILCQLMKIFMQIDYFHVEQEVVQQGRVSV